MPVTSGSEIAEILLELGQPSTGDLASALPGIWGSYADKALVAPRLQGLYSRRAAVDVLLGSVWREVAVTDQELTVALQQRSDHLSMMRERIAEDIALVERMARAGRTPVVGALTTVAPEPVPPGSLDPNDPVYAGSPTERFWGGDFVDGC